MQLGSYTCGILKMLLLIYLLIVNVRSEDFKSDNRNLPILNIENKTIDVQSNTSFTLECTGSDPVDWKIHDACCNISQRVSKFDSFEINGTQGTYRSQLTVEDAIFSDTGRYSCFYNRTQTDHNDLNSSVSVYVFVNDNQNPEHLFAERGREVFASLKENANNTIPCIPTNSKAKVTLHKTNDLKNEVKADEVNITFDPTKGFEIRYIKSNYNICKDHSCSLVCKATLGEMNATKEIWYFVLPYSDHLAQPDIDQSGALHPMINQSFTLNCTIEVQRSISLNLEWELPKEVPSGRYIIGHISYVPGGDYSRAFTTLTVIRAQPSDAGNYTCHARDHNFHETKHSVTLEIHDKEKEPFLSFETTLKEGDHISVKENKILILVVGINKHTKDVNERLKIDWLKDGQKDPKFNETKTENQTILRIFNFTREDAGSYMLTVVLGELKRNLTIKVFKEGEPIMQSMQKQPEFFKVNQVYILQCDINGYPRMNFEWRWKPCDSKVKCAKNWVETSNLNQEISNKSELGIQLYRNTLTVKAIKSGYYQFKANNTHGIKEEIIPFFVTDAEDGFEIKTNATKLVEMDNATLTCKANKFKFSSVLWKFNEPILKTLEPNMVVEYNETEYSHYGRIIFKNNGIRLSDEGNYVCEAKPLNASDPDKKNHTLKVQKIMAPSVLKNESNEFQVNAMATNVSLKCISTGIPPPSITWHRGKEESLVQSNHLITLTDNNQVLNIKVATKGYTDGEFKCKVKNRGGEESRIFQVRVEGEDQQNKTVIALAVILPILIIVLIVVAVVFCLKIRREKNDEKEFEALSRMLSDKGNLEFLSPDMPLSDQAELLPYDHKWEFPKDRLKLGRILGTGAFGRVVKAEAIGLEDPDTISTVAVKMLKERADINQRKALMAELKILIHLGKHLNIVNLLGAVTKNTRKGEVMIIVEYCRYGNLRNYLLRHKAGFVDQIDPVSGNLDPNAAMLPNLTKNDNAGGMLAGLSNPNYETRFSRQKSINYADLEHNSQDIGYLDTGVAESVIRNVAFRWLSMREDYHDQKTISTCDLLCFAFQAARGMEYLASRKLIHRDLAARNVLLADDNVLKICDFGLAKDCYKYDNYVKKGDGLLPIKWMAIESISDRVFTSKSDVWAYGVLLWEIFTLGGDPYPGTEIDSEFYKKLKKGHRMEKPDFAPADVYDIMKECWSHKPVDRPDFATLGEVFGEFLQSGVKDFYLDLNAQYVNLNAEKKIDYLAMCGASSNYLRMNSQEEQEKAKESVNYDNIGIIRAVDDGPVPSEPMEIVPMIQLEPLSVRWKKNRPAIPPLTVQNDYLKMGNTTSKTTDNNHLSRLRKGNDSARSQASSGFHSDLDGISLEDNTEPSFDLTMNETRDGIEV